jgi:hypothetical protein
VHTTYAAAEKEKMKKKNKRKEKRKGKKKNTSAITMGNLPKICKLEDIGKRTLTLGHLHCSLTTFVTMLPT